MKKRGRSSNNKECYACIISMRKGWVPWDTGGIPNYDYECGEDGIVPIFGVKPSSSSIRDVKVCYFLFLSSSL